MSSERRQDILVLTNNFHNVICSVVAEWDRQLASKARNFNENYRNYRASLFVSRQFKVMYIKHENA